LEFKIQRGIALAIGGDQQLKSRSTHANTKTSYLDHVFPRNFGDLTQSCDGVTHHHGVGVTHQIAKRVEETLLLD
jgi:hypothetical protein